jgi:pre-mRNA-splicing helicase BRR2
MDIHIQSYDVPHFPSLMLGMAKPAYLAINDWAGQKPVIAFVPSRKQCKLTATDILTYCSANQEEKRFLNIDEEARLRNRFLPRGAHQAGQKDRREAV